jgi:hypothetical protein
MHALGAVFEIEIRSKAGVLSAKYTCFSLAELKHILQHPATSRRVNKAKEKGNRGKRTPFRHLACGTAHPQQCQGLHRQASRECAQVAQDLEQWMGGGLLRTAGKRRTLRTTTSCWGWLPFVRHRTRCGFNFPQPS